MLLEAGMKKNKLVKISAIIAAALLISACSTNVRGPQEKIAHINSTKISITSAAAESKHRRCNHQTGNNFFHNF
jgi:predicted small secreted protein